MRAAGKNTPYLIIFYFLVSALLLLLDSKGVISFLHRGVQSLTIPFKTSLFDAKRASLSPLTAISDKEDKESEIEKLRQEKADLLSQLSALISLKEENERMRYLLGSTLPSSWQFAPLRIVGRVGDTLVATAQLKPELGGTVIVSVELNAKNSGVFIGKIDQALGREIKIILPTSSLSKIPVIVRSREGARHASGILIGRGGKMRLEQVLSSETPSEGDLVLTSGEGAPPELLIGYVIKLLPSEASAWKSAEVKTAINVENLDFVFVVTKY